MLIISICMGKSMRMEMVHIVDLFLQGIFIKCIGVAPITQLRTCDIKIVRLKGGHLMW